MRTMLQRTFGIGVALGMLNCAGNGATDPQSGGTTGMPSNGGSATAGGSGAVGVGGESTVDESGGATSLAEGGASPSGGRAATSSNTSTGGRAATSSKASGGAATGGSASGSKSAVGGSSATNGAGAGGSATGGATGTSASTSPSEVDCNAVMPTGGQTYTGSNVNGTINGLNYGIWTNGSGGDITVFPNANAFSTSWNESKNFLAHLGLDFWGSAAKEYTAFGTITAQFVEKKSGTAGQFSMIGIYGWTQNPCVEWYINEDSYNGLYGGGSVTATIDGGTYSLSSTTTTGTEGANACESGHTGPWTQMKSTRKTARQCGTVTVSDHFAEWEKQGWKLGKLTMVHINVEVGGGNGSIDFPVANVTTTSK